jgi:hypothetical protein
MSKNILVSLVLCLSFGCVAREAVDDDPDCRCDGEVPGGRLDAACGSYACVGGIGYFCTDVNTAVHDIQGCTMPPDPGGEHALTAHALEYMRDLIPEARQGNVHLRVNLELTNSTSEPRLLGFGAYSLETESGLQFVGSVATHDELVDEPCPVDASLAPGRSHRCDVVFEIPRDEAPAFLFHIEMADDRTPIVPDWREELNRLCVTSDAACSNCMRGAAAAACQADVEALPDDCRNTLVGFEYSYVCGVELGAPDDCEMPIARMRSCVDAACAADCD